MGLEYLNVIIPRYLGMLAYVDQLMEYIWNVFLLTSLQRQELLKNRLAISLMRDSSLPRMDKQF